MITFVLSNVVPHDPALLLLGDFASEEDLAKIREKLGLNEPLHVQYLVYIRNLLGGDWGQSFRTRRPVLDDIFRYFPATVELMIAAMLLALLIAIPLGVLAAVRHNSYVDHLARIFTLGGVSTPTFWFAMMMQIVFFRWLGWLPVHGRLGQFVMLSQPLKRITGLNVVDSLVTGNWAALRGSLVHLILPAFTLAFYRLGRISRMTRAAMLETLRQEYVTSARAYGLPGRVVTYKYALKNALIPIITVVGISIGGALSGTVLIESIFDWPGLGLYVVDAMLALDLPAIMGSTILIATIYVLINLIADILYAFVDPRIRY